MAGIEVTYTLTIGELLQVASILGGGLLVFQQMRSSLDSHSERLREVEVELKKQTEILVSVARQDEQIKAIQLRLQALEGTS